MAALYLLIDDKQYRVHQIPHSYSKGILLYTLTGNGENFRIYREDGRVLCSCERARCRHVSRLRRVGLLQGK